MFSNETTPQIYINEGGRSSLVKSNLNNNQSPPPPSTRLNLTVLLDFHKAQPRAMKPMTCLDIRSTIVTTEPLTSAKDLPR